MQICQSFPQRKYLEIEIKFLWALYKTYGYVFFVSSISSHFKKCYFNWIKRGICFCFRTCLMELQVARFEACECMYNTFPNSKVILSFEKLNNFPKYTKMISGRIGTQIQVRSSRNTAIIFLQTLPSLVWKQFHSLCWPYPFYFTSKYQSSLGTKLGLLFSVFSLPGQLHLFPHV